MLLNVESRDIQQSCQSRGSKPSPPFAIQKEPYCRSAAAGTSEAGATLYCKGGSPNQALFKAVTHRAYLQIFAIRNQEYLTSILIYILIGSSGSTHGLAAPHNTSTEYRIA